MFPFFLDLFRGRPGSASLLKIASLTSVYNRIFTYETLDKDKKFLSENFGKWVIGEGEGSLLEKAPFPLPKPHPYPPKTFVRVGGGTGGLEELGLGIRLPELRQGKARKHFFLDLS